MKITTLMLSCGRFDLLKRALESYKAAMPESTDLIIVDDSMIKQGQAKSLDLLVELGMKTEAEYFMLLEDDWEFISDKNWFWDSLTVLKEHPEVMIVGISIPDYLRPFMGPKDWMGHIPILRHDPWRISSNHGYWNGWVSSPRLMRRADLQALPKFSGYISEEVYDQQVWLPLYKVGRRSIWLFTTYTKHIGWGRSLFPEGDKLPPEQRTWLKAHQTVL